MLRLPPPEVIADTGRQMKACEPRDLLDRIQDICLFEGQPMITTSDLVERAIQNYFSAGYSFGSHIIGTDRDEFYTPERINNFAQALENRACSVELHTFDDEHKVPQASYPLINQWIKEKIKVTYSGFQAHEETLPDH